MARISAPFGIQGWIKLKTFTEFPDGLADHDRWWIGSGQDWKAYSLLEFAARPAATVAKLEGVDDRNGAESLRGLEVVVSRKDLGDAGPEAIYWMDLVGLEVVSLSGEALGKVDGLFETGETSVLVVMGERERMIPFVPQYVKTVDREAKRITVDWEAGYDA
jgi:16S rRNA processing protein RimM